MSKKLLMNNYSENDEIILCENYSPNGQRFYLWQDKPINLEENEFYIKVDFTNCKPNIMENILSIGLNISSWTGFNIHIYCRDKYIEFNYVNEGGYYRFSYNTKSFINEIVINKNGVFVNNICVQANDNIISIYKTVSNKINSADSLSSIGSQEGVYRSHALYHKVCLRKYVERG